MGTFLAEWLAGVGRKPDWKPLIQTDPIKFVISDTVPDLCNEDNESAINRVCQQSLQKELAKMYSKDKNFPSKHALIMLFLLSYHRVRIKDEQVNDAEVDSFESQSAAYESSMSMSSIHDNVDVSVRVCRVSSVLGMQKISVMIRTDFEKRIISLSLEH